MTVVSDTNILASLAAATAYPLLHQLFPHSPLLIPLEVQYELQSGLERGKQYLTPVLDAIQSKAITLVLLNELEFAQIQTLPEKLHQGERAAIIIAQTRHALLLSNDRAALRYCRANQIEALDLPLVLRLLWTRHVVSRGEVLAYIEQMEQIENLILKPEIRERIFAPSRSTR